MISLLPAIGLLIAGILGIVVPTTIYPWIAVLITAVLMLALRVAT